MSHFHTSIFLTTSLSFCHSPSTVVRKAFAAVTAGFPGTQFCHSFARQPSRHCEHSEQGEPSDSELSPHASLISWQRRSMVVWQLKATLPSSKSSRKSATTSLDQSCPMTSMVRHSLLRSYTSQPKEVSLAEQRLIHSGLLGQPCLHMPPRSGDGLPLDPRFASC